MNVRGQVIDVWDTIEVSVTGEVTFADLKATCLDRAIGRKVDPSTYTIKFRGALVTDEDQTLGAADEVSECARRAFGQQHLRACAQACDPPPQELTVLQNSSRGLRRRRLHEPDPYVPTMRR